MKNFTQAERQVAETIVEKPLDMLTDVYGVEYVQAIAQAVLRDSTDDKAMASLGRELLQLYLRDNKSNHADAEREIEESEDTEDPYFYNHRAEAAHYNRLYSSH